MKFTATLLDGQVLTEADYQSVSMLALEKVVELIVEAEGFPAVTLSANLAAGERVNCFIRHSIPVGNPELPKVSVPVYEIRRDEKVLCRLYWHPQKGPILTSQDLYF